MRDTLPGGSAPLPRRGLLRQIVLWSRTRTKFQQAVTVLTIVLVLWALYTIFLTKAERGITADDLASLKKQIEEQERHKLNAEHRKSMEQLRARESALQAQIAGLQAKNSELADKLKATSGADEQATAAAAAAAAQLAQLQAELNALHDMTEPAAASEAQLQTQVASETMRQLAAAQLSWFCDAAARQSVDTLPSLDDATQFSPKVCLGGQPEIVSADVSTALIDRPVLYRVTDVNVLVESAHALSAVVDDPKTLQPFDSAASASRYTCCQSTVVGVHPIFGMFYSMRVPTVDTATDHGSQGLPPGDEAPPPPVVHPDDASYRLMCFRRSWAPPVQTPRPAGDQTVDRLGVRRSLYVVVPVHESYTSQVGGFLDEMGRMITQSKSEVQGAKVELLLVGGSPAFRSKVSPDAETRGVPIRWVSLLPEADRKRSHIGKVLQQQGASVSPPVHSGTTEDVAPWVAAIVGALGAGGVANDGIMIVLHPGTVTVPENLHGRLLSMVAEESSLVLITPQFTLPKPKVAYVAAPTTIAAVVSDWRSLLALHVSSTDTVGTSSDAPCSALALLAQARRRGMNVFRIVLGRMYVTRPADAIITTVERPLDAIPVIQSKCGCDADSADDSCRLVLPLSAVDQNADKLQVACAMSDGATLPPFGTQHVYHAIRNVDAASGVKTLVRL